MHFVDLSLVMEGGHTEIVHDLKEKQVPINFCRPPYCCFGLCYKDISYEKCESNSSSRKRAETKTYCT